MIQFENYHKHDHLSNLRVSDSVVTAEEYAARAVELGHTILSSCQHGFQGNAFETIELAKKYGLKPLIGAEAYFVKNRSLDIKDSTNCHIFLGAKNENGRRCLNDVLSEANLTGFYRQPRLDIPLLLSLPSDDVIVTTACIGGVWRYEDADDIVRVLAEHFKHFYLEVQYHDCASQRDLNQHILKLRDELRLPIIMGCDSHYIYPEQAQARTDFLQSKGMDYPDEDSWYMDYPDGDKAYQRFAKQCILTDAQIREAMDNTNIFTEVEEYDCPVFNDEIKLPTLYPDYTQEQKDEEYKKLVWAGWEEYKKDIPEELYPLYEKEIEAEMQVVVDTKMADYFICDYYIMKKGKANGGWLTRTGRGCFTKDSMIATMSGYKHINEVVIGDKVFDKDGVPQPVTNTMSYRINEPLVKINYAYMSDKFSPMTCTMDHKILIRSSDGNLSWKEAGLLKTGDYVCSPRLNICEDSAKFIDLNDYNTFGYEYDDKYIYEKNPYRNKSLKYNPSDVADHIGCGKSVIENIANGKTIENKKNKKIVAKLLSYTGFGSIKEYADYIQKERTTRINRFIPNDYFMNFWIGEMYGDGFSSDGKTEIGLAINPLTHKDSINKMVFEMIAERVGIRTTEKKSKNRNLSQVYMHSNIFANYIHTELFASQKRKTKIFNPKLLKQSKENLKGLLSGMSMADGSFCDMSRKSFDNTSLSLIWAYRILTGATSNDPTSISVRNPWVTKENYECIKSFKVRTYTNARRNPKKTERVLSDDKYVYLPVRGIEIVDTTETDVYDITVENSHSYMLNNIVVHNSCCSFLTNALLGFSDIDRIAAPIHLYPERFMTTERVLSSGSLPDLDQNEAPTEPFVRAQAEILGQDHSYPMVAYGTMQKSAAWKLYAKSQDIPFEIANAVSEQIQRYEKAVKHTSEDEKDSIDINDYISKEFKEIYERSKNYLGVITSWSIAPCSSLIYQGSIRKEIGLVKVKDNICCLADGKAAEKHHMLKNDHLKVSVVDLIFQSYHRIGIEPPKVRELLSMCPPEDIAWDIYEKGCTLGINQCEQPGTTARIMKYKPRNISELSAFVAAIRPGGASFYKDFESRKPFSYGVKAFDDLMQTKEFPYSFPLYQEQIMRALNYAGIEMSECYTAIKNIAKKRVEKVLAYKETFINGFKQSIMRDEGKSEDEALEITERLWRTIEDSSSYSFNASHSYCVALDSLYGAWLKAHHPLEFYEVLLTLAEQKGDKDRMNAIKEEAESYFNIKFPPLKFGQDNRTIKADPEMHSITNTLASIKGFSSSVGDIMYRCQQENFTSFIDVLSYLDDNGIKEAKYKPLILVDYFSRFGNQNILLRIAEVWELLNHGKAKSVKKTMFSNPEVIAIAEKHSTGLRKDGKPATSYTFVTPEDLILCMKDIEKYIISRNLKDLDLRVKIQNSIDILGYVDVTTGREEDRRRLMITDVAPMKDKSSGRIWSYRIGTKSVGSGKTARLTVKTEVFDKNPIKAGDIIYAADLYKNNSGYWYLLQYSKE